MRATLYFQEDGDYACTAKGARKKINTLGGLPGCGLMRTPNSPYLSPLDYFYWGALKCQLRQLDLKPLVGDGERHTKGSNAARTLRRTQWSDIRVASPKSRRSQGP